jgi:hypothetical protein
MRQSRMLMVDATRPLLNRKRVQHCLQDPLHRLARLHHLPHDDSLQADQRSEHRHLSHTVSVGRRGGAGGPLSLPVQRVGDPMGLQHLARVRRDPATTLHAAADGRGRDDHHALSVRAGAVPRALHPQLDLAICYRAEAQGGLHRCGGGHHTDGAVQRFLLDLLQQGVEREEIQAAGMIACNG